METGVVMSHITSEYRRSALFGRRIEIVSWGVLFALSCVAGPLVFAIWR
jgi:hypothetical protein